MSFVIQKSKEKNHQKEYGKRRNRGKKIEGVGRECAR